MPDMDEIRAAVVERIRVRADMIERIKLAGDEIYNAEGMAPEAQRHGNTERQPSIRSARTVLGLVADTIKADQYADVEQLAFLLARDVIAPQAKESQTAVTFITGNAYVPALRSFSEAETVWNASLGIEDLWEIFVEALDRKLLEMNIIVAAPEDDNCLFAVDGNRWTFVGDIKPDDEDSLESDWAPIKELNNG